MKFLFILPLLLLGGCASNTLIVSGNMPGTAWVAQKATQVTGEVCRNYRLNNERRSAEVAKYNRDAYVEVRHTCTR